MRAHSYLADCYSLPRISDALCIECMSFLLPPTDHLCMCMEMITTYYVIIFMILITLMVVLCPCLSIVPLVAFMSISPSPPHVFAICPINYFPNYLPPPKSILVVHVYLCTLLVLNIYISIFSLKSCTVLSNSKIIAMIFVNNLPILRKRRERRTVTIKKMIAMRIVVGFNSIERDHIDTDVTRSVSPPPQPIRYIVRGLGEHVNTKLF